MAAEYVSFTSGSGNADPAVVTHNHPNNPGHALVACIQWRPSAALTAVRWGGAGGTLMTLARASEVSGRRSAIYYLLLPTLTGSADLWIDQPEEFWVAGVISLKNVSVLGDTDAASGTGTSVSLTLDSTVDDIAIDSLASESAAATAGGGQTQRWNTSPAGSLGGAASTEPGSATSTTMSWSTVSAGDNHNFAAAIFRGAVGGSQVIWY